MEFTACQNKVTFTQVTVQLGHSAKLSKADSRRANEEDATEKKRPQSHKQEKRKANQQYSGVLSKDAFHQEGCFPSGRMLSIREREPDRIRKRNIPVLGYWDS